LSAEPPRLVIFDCDGVLVDSEGLSNGLLAEMLSAEGLELDVAASRRLFQGLLLAEVFATAASLLGRSLPADLPERFESERSVLFRRELRAVPGAVEAVARVRAAGAEVCVASQGKPEKIRLSLELTGMSDLFEPDALFSAYSVARGKPHPDLFLHAAASMGVAPDECVVVEDTPSGVAGAVAAGMRVLGYAADSDERQLRLAGAEILDSLGTLSRRLGLA
jgi:HAD superfamily hydrolase (TIGR01509 family)